MMRNTESFYEKKANTNLLGVLGIGLFFFTTLVNASDSNFLGLCQVTLKGNSALCHELQKQLFDKDTKTGITPFKLEQIRAPKLSIDSKIQFIVFNDPNYLSAVAYCYFVYRHWIDPQNISPDKLGSSSSGFSILNESIKEYHRWLDYDQQGKNCKIQVEKESGLPVFDLKATLKDSVALIALNPYASLINYGSDNTGIQNDFIATINHERIHAYQAQCPELDLWGQQQWLAQPEAVKLKFKQKYTSYNWSDITVAGREYSAFTYEFNPQDILKHKGKCKY